MMSWMIGYYLLRTGEQITAQLSIPLLNYVPLKHCPFWMVNAILYTFEIVSVHMYIKGLSVT